MTIEKLRMFEFVRNGGEDLGRKINEIIDYYESIIPSIHRQSELLVESNVNNLLGLIGSLEKRIEVLEKPVKDKPEKGYEILPCPICNMIPVGVEKTDDDEYQISCTNPYCSYSMQTFWKDTDIEAIADWNRHVQMIKGK